MRVNGPLFGKHGMQNPEFSLASRIKGSGLAMCIQRSEWHSEKVWTAQVILEKSWLGKLEVHQREWKGRLVKAKKCAYFSFLDRLSTACTG
jgi:hypothetical protein